MKIAVLGTGMVGDAIGSKLIELGHEVVMGSRTRENLKARAFVDKHKGLARAGTFAEAASFGALIFNCTLGSASIEALQMAGVENLKGKIIIDISNPLEFSKGAPPNLTHNLSNTNSVGEEIQLQFPESMVVKTLNTIWCGLMVNPAMINGGDHNVFISGNNEEAKVKVRELLQSFGWMEDNIFDLGGIETARGPEMYLPLWLRIYRATNNGAFNIKIVS